MSSMDRVVLVGAGGGVGRACSALLSRKYEVLALLRDESRLESLPEGVEPLIFDVERLDDIDGFMRELAARYGKLKALVYCAGLQNIKPVRVLKASEMERIFRVNLYAPILFARAFAKRSVHSADNPSIVFITSIAAFRPEKGIVPYSASKAALESAARGLALELAPIRVNCVAPGFLETAMTEAYPDIYSESFKEELRRSSPLGICTTEQVCRSVEFLLSESAACTTGESLKVDGGALL